MVSLGIFTVASLRHRCKRGGIGGEPKPPLLRRCHFPPPPHPRLALVPFLKTNFEMRGGLKIVSDTDSDLSRLCEPCIDRRG